MSEFPQRAANQPTGWDFSDSRCSLCGQFGLHSCPITASYAHPRCDCHSCTQSRLSAIERDFAAIDGQQIQAAVLAERERCAKIAEAASAAYEAALEAIAKEPTWEYALNEMTDAVNERFFGGVREMMAVAARIRNIE